ncbi:glycoside hydrolase family 68 protein, partial [Elusimicrobiota bacterium]
MNSPLHLWDNWACRYAGDGLIHRFSLAAPGTLPPEKRHEHARIHHWTSVNGREWAPLGPALAPGPPGGFDDQALWSGCAVDTGGRLALFYTGVRSGRERGQRICAAFSTDGKAFEKHAGPVLEPDELYGYDTGASDGLVMAWRDPCVFQDPDSGRWHMVFSAKRR